MDLEPVQFLKLLHDHSENPNEGPNKCYQLLNILSEFLTQERVHLQGIDLFLHSIFKTSQSFPSFVTKVVNKKLFKSAITKIFEIIYSLINNFGSKLEKYVREICDTCFKVIKSSLVSSDEKVKSLEVLIICLEKIDKSVELPHYYNEIYNNLVKSISIKKCDSVEEKIFIALGTFAKQFQYLIINNEHLRNIFLNGLEAQMVQKDFSNRILCGVFTGLDYFCESFPFDLNSKEDLVIIGKVYKYIDKVSVPKANVKIGNRAAIKFLANNMSLFINLIIEKYQYWHETLTKWLKMENENQKVGILALGAFYRNLGSFLMNDVSNQYKHITMYFSKYLKETLTNENVSNREKRLCLQGLSSFSGVYQRYVEDEDMKDFLCLLIQNFEQTFVFNQDVSADTLEYLPFYIQTKSAVMMIRLFPQMPYSCHGAVIEAVVSTFYFLLVNDEKLCDTFIENVIYQGVVWTCSHRHMLESYVEGDSQIITVKNYFVMWKGLLKILPLRKLDKYGIYLHDRKCILIKITDKLIRNLLILINKLDVSLKINNTLDAITDIESAYKVSEANDFAIFLNLVDFYQEIFEEFDPFMLKKCLCKLILHLIGKCNKYPLLSGFYKLLTCCLKTANKINGFFDSVDSTQDVVFCVATLSKFIQTLLTQIEQYKGDLLVACLQVLLEYPLTVIQEMLQVCVPAFKIIFQVGRSHIKLAFASLDSLEKWQKKINCDEFDLFLNQIIPMLDCYLQSRSLGDLVGNDNFESKRKTTQALKKRRIFVESEPELNKLQMKILTFIGQQRNSLCRTLAVGEENISLAVTGNEKYLKIVLPYDDIKLDMYIDKLLPRIVHIALYSTDRKMRVMACEVLQAVVMIFLGKTKQMTHSELTDLNQLLKHMSMPLLQLGCDMDQVVEQLFRPLCFQLIHWYTHAFQFRGEHSAIIMEAVLEGIVHPNDSALRDFCGKCVKEYIAWTIKQTNEKKLSKDPISVKMLLKKMRFYSLHPDPCKKLGAALIFNNIYRELREELSLLSMFWAEFLHVFITSLSTYEHETTIDETSVSQINAALIHIQRGFIEKADLFNNNDKDRRIPPGIKGGILKDVVFWLLEQSGSKSPYCRKTCMEMFCNITPYTKNYKTLQEFINDYYKDINWIQMTYENFLTQYPTIEFLKNESHNGPIKWMQEFLRALDGWIFVITRKLMATVPNLSTTITQAINYFVETLSNTTLDKILTGIYCIERTFSDFEKTVYDRQRCQAVSKILIILNSLKNGIAIFYNQSLWNFITNIFFNQEVLGLESGDNTMTPLLKDFVINLPENVLLELLLCIEDQLKKHITIDFNLKSNISYKNRSILKGLNILQSVSLKQFDYMKYNNGMITALLNKFFEELENDTIYLSNLQNTTITFCHLIFDFALSNNDELAILIDYLYKPYYVQLEDGTGKITFGTYFLNLFEDSLIDKLTKNFEFFLNFCIEHNKSIDLTMEFINLMVAYTTSKKKFRSENEVVLKSVVAKWDNFEKYFVESNINMEHGIVFVRNLLPLIKLYKINIEPLKKWLFFSLSHGIDLKQKSDMDVEAEFFFILVEILDVSDDDDTRLSQCLRDTKSKLLLETISIPIEVKIIFLEKLFSIVPKIKTPELLIFILEIYSNNFANSGTFDLKNVLKNYIAKKSEVQKRSLLKIYDLCMNNDFAPYQNYKLINETTTVFQLCSHSVFQDFLSLKINEVLHIMKKPMDSDNLVEKILNFIIVEILFGRCSIRITDSETSHVTLTCLPEATSNKPLIFLLLNLTLNAVKHSTENISDDELLRLYKCHSFNACASIISNSLEDENFYTKLFIRRNDNIDVLWSSLIDVTRSYLFQTDFESFPKRRKILINIRNDMKASQKVKNSGSQSVHYLESVRVYNSSLSEDLTKFDFTNSVVRSNYEQSQDQTFHTDNEIELDSTDINSHECMATVCGLIEHMVSYEITKLPKEGEGDYILPVWVNGIVSLLLDPNTHTNVKIFWVKVIDNTLHIFKYFAKWFLKPLLKFIVDGCAGTYMNYFLTDMVGILATFSTNAVPTTESEILLSAELLKILIDNLNNERQDMFKYHLELIRLLVEAWKTSVKVPYDSIYSKVNIDPTSKSVEVGIHIASIFLANKILPWKENMSDFCKALFKIAMKNKFKSIYKPCAETIGLSLAVTSHEELSPKILGNVHILLKKFDDVDKYANMLESVVLHYPLIADEYHLNVLLSKLHSVPKQLKIVYLKIMLKRTKVLETLSDFKNEKWDYYVSYDSLEVQLLTLEIIQKCIDVLQQSIQFQSIVESVVKHVSNSSVLCRSRVFDIAISICRKQESSIDIIDLCKNCLVKGLTDSDLEIREKVYNFWRDNPALSSQISERFPYIMRHMYESNIENEFLGYSCYLLLDSVKNTEEYHTVLFDHPLEDCDFEDYHLETNWRARHLSMAPLFRETVQNTSEDLEMSYGNVDELRQTQTVREFVLTQNIREKQFSQITMSESSLHIRTQDDSTFLNPNVVPISQKYRIPKRRFIRDKSKIESHFAQREVNKLVQKNERRKDMVKERENKVVLYRNYRKGDLPDIQITLQAFLDPLQALILHDDELSKILYLEIFHCIWRKTKSHGDFINELSVGIKTIFDSSIYFNRSLFRALFDILLLCKNTLTVSADLVVTVSQSSGLRALGILLLEEYLISSDENPTSSKKMCGFTNDKNVHFWVKLAELYKETNELDVVKSIFLHKIEGSDQVKNAILSESHGRWKDAQDLYKLLLESNENVEANDFYYESYFRCFAYLGEWGSLVKSVDSTMSHTNGSCWGDLWDEDFGQRKLMPWYINGHLKNSLFTQIPPNQFLTELNDSLNSDKLSYLENNFCEEISMLWIFQNDVDEAEKYVKIYLNNFLSHWQRFNVLYTSSRYSILLQLRNVIDIQKFSKVSNNLNIQSKTKIEELIHYWKTTSYETSPSILFSEERLLYRRQFVKLLTKKIQDSHEEELDELLVELREITYKLNEHFLETALALNNFYMTKKYLPDFSKHNTLKHKLILSKLAQIKSTMIDNPENKFEILIKGCEALDQIFAESEHTFLKVVASVTLFDHLVEISKLLDNNEHLFHTKKPSITNFMGNSDITSNTQVAFFGADKLKSTLDIYEHEMQNIMETDILKSNAELVAIADAYVKLSHFAIKQDNYFTNFITFVLKAMKFNSSEGRQLFPCIIMAKNFSAEDSKQFLKETENIPVWMFLAWIPQIIVNIDSPKVSTLSPIILKIAKMYPQAIMYAYRLSKENYKLELADSKSLTEKLDEMLLSDDNVNKFLRALSYIGIPVAILSYYIKKMIRLAHANKLIQLRNFYNNFLKEVYSCNSEPSDIYQMQGNMFKKISKYEKEIKVVERLIDKKDANTDIIKLLKKIDVELCTVLSDSKEFKKNSRLLKDYSPWLSNFSAERMNLDLEIPGQYDGHKLPLLQHHVKISGFCPNVSIMTSLRKPIKITILGNDAKQYPYLIKFGEDVRQDQRIQQLFSLMNRRFETDTDLRGQKLTILTYQVIPLTSNLGMIQWIDNTKSLQESMKGLKSSQIFEKVKENFHKWIFKNRQLSFVDAYGKAALSYSRNETIVKFRSFVSHIEWDVLRTFFLLLGTNVESFFVLRNNFIISYAVMCISHWILGVGDRHLSNSLICLQTGKVMGIDFGHAFGTSTQILGVPELVPFRLTPHIVNLMEPLGEKCLFREIMIHCLRSLKSNSNSLLSTMKVFIEEPSIDWLEHCAVFSENTDSSSTMWYPAQKINQAKRKLHGVNPKNIFIEDLNAGHQKNKSYLNAYVKLVEGCPEHDVRANKEADNLSLEDQVDCLIDQATDYNLLGRMFEGWTPWV